MSEDGAREAAGDENGLIRGYALDGHGGARQITWQEIHAWPRSGPPLWLHLDRTDGNTERWLRTTSGLDSVAIDALLREETRPRCSLLPDGLLVILRGVNLNPGAEPEDMVSLRLWVDEHRLLTMRRRRLMAVLDLQAALDAGSGPISPSSLLVALAERLTARIEPVLTHLDDEMDGAELEALEGAGESLRARLASVRRRAVRLRRHIAPQREALLGLIGAQTPSLNAGERLRLREVADHITRYVEDLDALRERAAVTHDELSTRLAEATNRRMYILSIVAAVFLPLGLITGLLGVNVGGIPGTHDDWAFWIVIALLTAIGGLTVWILRLRNLF